MRTYKDSYEVFISITLTADWKLNFVHTTWSTITLY